VRSEAARGANPAGTPVPAIAVHHMLAAPRKNFDPCIFHKDVEPLNSRGITDTGPTCTIAEGRQIGL
jgi:hypothetical protein